jgi:aspartyl-tRNA synthetase
MFETIKQPFQFYIKTMYRTKTNGELRLANVGEVVTLAGWVQRTRKMGGMTFVDLRDRYGITQIVFNNEVNAELCEQANHLGREYVIQVVGTVAERSSKNANIPTGEIEIIASKLNILSESITPPFTIEDNTDGGDDLRMKYRYLDLRRNAVRRNLELRHDMAILIRNYLDDKGFLEVETPILIGSTPEGARDFIVPSRMNPGQFYALPQSPQTLKQLLMVAGFDRYFQIAKCFRDEDLRADRQPEFTQIDCEMSFVDQEDVIEVFEGLARHLFKQVRGVNLPEKLDQMTWHDAMRLYGSDKPDRRFGMTFVEVDDVLKGTGTFPVFNEANYIGAICAPGCADYTRKQLDGLVEFVKRPQVGAKGLVYVKFNTDGTVKSSIDKFYEPAVWQQLKEKMGANDGDLVLIMSGDNANKTRVQLCTLRLEMGERLGLRDKDKFECLWIIDFPLFEWSDEEQRLMATHHPFTMPNPDDIPLLDEHPERVRAKAYDFVCNGIEVGGGSLRIHDGKLQAKMFDILGFTPERAMAQFGFLINAFKYGAPPHAGLAFGFDRFVSIMAGLDSIRDCIAFPKNNSGRDVMLDAPSPVDQSQLDELYIDVDRERLKAENKA